MFKLTLVNLQEKDIVTTDNNSKCTVRKARCIQRTVSSSRLGMKLGERKEIYNKRFQEVRMGKWDEIPL